MKELYKKNEVSVCVCVCVEAFKVLHSHLSRGETDSKSALCQYRINQR